MLYRIIVAEEVREITVYWPKDAKKLAVCVSGGLDSALLFWLWANYPIPDGCELIPVTIERSEGTTNIASEIVKKTEELTGLRFNHLMLDAEPAAGDKPVSMPMRKAYQTGLFDFIISGDTENPTEVASANGFSSSKRRTPDTNTNDRRWHVPFIHLDKRFTVKLITDLGLKWIEEISNSCTQRTDLRCGICWWCRERKWAYDSLSLTDSGTK